MLATVPLDSPVATMANALAVAESVMVAEPHEPTGPAIDRIIRFLRARTYVELRRHGHEVLEVLHLLGGERAARATGYLARRADSAAAAEYWADLYALVTLG